MVQRLGEAVRSTAAAVADGTLAGFGGRLLMRVVGATSDDAAQGRLQGSNQGPGRGRFEVGKSGHPSRPRRLPVASLHDAGNAWLVGLTAEFRPPAPAALAGIFRQLRRTERRRIIDRLGDGTERFLKMADPLRSP